MKYYIEYQGVETEYNTDQFDVLWQELQQAVEENGDVDQARLALDDAIQTTYGVGSKLIGVTP